MRPPTLRDRILSVMVRSGGRARPFSIVDIITNLWPPSEAQRIRCHRGTITTKALEAMIRQGLVEKCSHVRVPWLVVRMTDDGRRLGRRVVAAERRAALRRIQAPRTAIVVLDELPQEPKP